ncbi:MAG: hypothetical protein IJ599_04250 [Alphaproteobacteria bacterium]|nr:hypothetical protein [Alphaproteobacteria bacterium]
MKFPSGGGGGLAAPTIPGEDEVTLPLRGNNEPIYGASAAVVLRFAQKEAFKNHLAKVIQEAAEDSWLKYKKFSKSIWNYITDVFNDVVVHKVEVSEEIYDFAMEREADNYSGANLNALVLRNVINYAFLLAPGWSNLSGVDKLQKEFDSQEFSGDTVSGKYDKLIDFTGKRIGKTKKFNQKTYGMRIQKAVSDIKKYFKGCRLGEYVDKLIECVERNFGIVSLYDDSPQCIHFPGVKAYVFPRLYDFVPDRMKGAMAELKNSAYSDLENFGYVEFENPLSLDQKVKFAEGKEEYDAKVKKVYFSFGKHQQQKAGDHFNRFYLLDCKSANGYSSFTGIGFFDEHMKLKGVFKDTYEIYRTKWLLQENISKIIKNIDGDLDDYRKAADSEWTEKFVDTNWMTTTENFAPNGDLDKYLQEYRENARRYNIISKWLEKTRDAEKIDIIKLLDHSYNKYKNKADVKKKKKKYVDDYWSDSEDEKDIEENNKDTIEVKTKGKVYFPAGSFHARTDEAGFKHWIWSFSLTDDLGHAINHSMYYYGSQFLSSRMYDNYEKISKARLYISRDSRGKHFVLFPETELPKDDQKLCVPHQVYDQLLALLEDELKKYTPPAREDKIKRIQDIQYKIEERFERQKNALLKVFDELRKEKSSIELPQNFDEIMEDGDTAEQMELLSNVLKNNSSTLPAIMKQQVVVEFDPNLIEEIEKFFSYL